MENVGIGDVIFIILILGLYRTQGGVGGIQSGLRISAHIFSRSDGLIIGIIVYLGQRGREGCLGTRLTGHACLGWNDQ